MTQSHMAMKRIAITYIKVFVSSKWKKNYYFSHYLNWFFCSCTKSWTCVSKKPQKTDRKRLTSGKCWKSFGTALESGIRVYKWKELRTHLFYWIQILSPDGLVSYYSSVNIHAHWIKAYLKKTVHICNAIGHTLLCSVIRFGTALFYQIQILSPDCNTCIIFVINIYPLGRIFKILQLIVINHICIFIESFNDVCIINVWVQSVQDAYAEVC